MTMGVDEPLLSETVPVYTPGCRPLGAKAMLNVAGVVEVVGVTESQLLPEFVVT
jgi:hypothetical protein